MDIKNNGGCQGLSRGENGEFLVCKMKRVLEMDGEDGCSIMWLYLMPLNHTLEMTEMINVTSCYRYFTQ